ncbi:hypothetical protein Tco_0202620, partial [Tanacetum coccineum]
MSSSTVTYTSISSDYEEPSDAGSLGVVVYGYNGLPMHLVDPYMEADLQAPEQAPPSPDYVPDPKHPPSPNYVPGPEEPEQAPLSLNYDQPLPDDALPTVLSPGYVADYDVEEGPNKDLEEDHVDYTADGGDDVDDESSDDDDKEEQEASKDDDDEE